MLAQHLGMPSSSTTRYDRLEAYPTMDPRKIERYSGQTTTHCRSTAVGPSTCFGRFAKLTGGLAEFLQAHFAQEDQPARGPN